MKVKVVLKEIKSDNITQAKRLIRARAIFLGRKLGLKPNQRSGNAVGEPSWERKIQQSIQDLRKHINMSERKKQ